jgi:hypothetical protein
MTITTLPQSSRQEHALLRGLALADRTLSTLVPGLPPDVDLSALVLLRALSEMPRTTEVGPLLDLLTSLDLAALRPQE